MRKSGGGNTTASKLQLRKPLLYQSTDAYTNATSTYSHPRPPYLTCDRSPIAERHGGQRERTGRRTISWEKGLRQAISIALLLALKPTEDETQDFCERSRLSWKLGKNKEEKVCDCLAVTVQLCRL
jgi:hypothetical protein